MITIQGKQKIHHQKVKEKNGWALTRLELHRDGERRGPLRQVTEWDPEGRMCWAWSDSKQVELGEPGKTWGAWQPRVSTAVPGKNLVWLFGWVAWISEQSKYSSAQLAGYRVALSLPLRWAAWAGAALRCSEWMTSPAPVWEWRGSDSTGALGCTASHTPSVTLLGALQHGGQPDCVKTVALPLVAMQTWATYLAP